MGILSWIGTRAPEAYLIEVENILRGTLKVPEQMLSTIRTSELKGVVEAGRRGGDSVFATSLRIGLTLYVTYLSGNAEQRALARGLYIPLKMNVGAAGADGAISLEESVYYDSVIGEATREALLKHSHELDD